MEQTNPTTDTAPGSPFAELSGLQTQIAAAVAAGASVTEASKSAGVHRSTIYEWTESDSAFPDAIEEARLDYIESLRDQLRSMSAKALSRIESLIDDPKTPPAVALRAALAVLQRPRFPAQSWSLPEPVYTPEQEQCANQFASLEAEYKALTREQKLDKAGKSDGGRQNPTKNQASDPPKPKIPRNAPCPCGSRKKYKRCCGVNAPGVYNVAA